MVRAQRPWFPSTNRKVLRHSPENSEKLAAFHELDTETSFLPIYIYIYILQNYKDCSQSVGAISASYHLFTQRQESRRASLQKLHEHARPYSSSAIVNGVSADALSFCCGIPVRGVLRTALSGHTRSVWVTMDALRYSMGPLTKNAQSEQGLDAFLEHRH